MTRRTRRRIRRRIRRKKLKKQKINLKNVSNKLRMNQRTQIIVASALAKKLYETKNKNKNNELVKATKNKWSNLKDEIKKMSKMKKKLNNHIKYQKLLKKFLSLTNKINQEKD